VAVNLSVEQFRNSNLTGYIREALNESGLDPSYLELEITESCAIRETGYICRTLQEIKALGVSISIDDFGTEYSSLSRIKQLPIDRIKMAMQFVHGIPVNAKDEAIAKIIINLAGSLGLKVIAEGVETESQFEFLKNRVCDEVQGYYFYKPMPASEFEKLLASMNNDFNDIFESVLIQQEKSGSPDR
jgi:EAL domain-containing protein (putative c-di-GMP-specific phosphodiesterase class I)